VLLLEMQLHQLQLLRRHHHMLLLLLLQYPAAPWTCRTHVAATSCHIHSRQQAAVVITAAALLQR
jgi:hypothetical protein